MTVPEPYRNYVAETLRREFDADAIIVKWNAGQFLTFYNDHRRPHIHTLRTDHQP